MKWETLYCPNRSCHHYGQPFGQGVLVKNGSGHGKKQALCRSCGRRVSLTYGTAYFDREADPAVFERAVRALAEGNSIQGTARIVQIDKDTDCAWLTRAAQQCHWVVLSPWRELTVTECQLDELWSFVHTKDQNLPTARHWCETYGDAWVWVAFVPKWRLVVGFVVGQRTPAQANLLLERVVYVTDDHVPLLYQRPMAGLSPRLAPCLWGMVSARAPREARTISGPTVPAPAAFAICPSG
jgi:hypothetical protein